jgi:hypothetical protein
MQFIAAAAQSHGLEAPAEKDAASLFLYNTLPTLYDLHGRNTPRHQFGKTRKLYFV